MANTSQPGCRLLAIPAELRLTIYDFVFTTPRPIDILMKKGPDNALRATCRDIYEESEKAFDKALVQRTGVRRAIMDHMINKMEKEGSVSPHRSRVMFPPVGRSATLLRSVNSHCLYAHACAKDNCYMCDDPAHRACFDCGRNVAVALWCLDHEDDAPALVERGHAGKKLTKLGEFIRACRPVAERRIQNRVDKSKVDRWWQRELDVQIAKDYRCELRRATVAAFWASPSASREAFTEEHIVELEGLDSSMAEFQRVVAKHGDDGFLDWEKEYKRRTAQRVAQAQKTGEKLPPQFPTKRDDERLLTLKHRWDASTLVGRRNARERSQEPISRPTTPLRERRALQLPVLVLPQTTMEPPPVF